MYSVITQNCIKSSVEECVFDYIALYNECQFNQNSLLRSCFLPYDIVALVPMGLVMRVVCVTVYKQTMKLYKCLVERKLSLSHETNKQQSIIFILLIYHSLVYLNTIFLRPQFFKFTRSHSGKNPKKVTLEEMGFF